LYEPSPFFITDWVTIVGKNVKTVDYQDAGKVIDAVENEDTIIISYESPPHSNYRYRVPKSYSSTMSVSNQISSCHDDDNLV
jgi:hypothetical protein